MMPTRSVVRIVPPADGGGVTAPSAGNDPSPSSVGTAAADGISSGVDGYDAATAITSSASKSASTIADGKKETAASDTTDRAESQVEGGNTTQEGTACNVEAEVVSISTTAGGQSKTLRREDFNSALEYLEAKYVKSIVIEDDAAAAAGSGNEQAAVKSRKNEVKISDSDDHNTEDKSGKACQLEKRAIGQNAQSYNKAEKLRNISSAGESDDASFGLGEKKVEGGNAAEAKKSPVESVAKLTGDKSAANTLVPTAAADATSKKTGVSAAESSAGSVPPKGFEHLPHMPHLQQPPQQQIQNTMATANTPTPNQYPQGYAPWPQCPPGWPFPPNPFGMMYPPYPTPYGFGYGMPPFVPQPQLQPMHGQHNASKPPDAGTNEAEGKPKSEVADEVDDNAKSTSNETSSTEFPPPPVLPPIDATTLGENLLAEKAKWYPPHPPPFGFGFGMPPFVPQAQLQSMQGGNNTQPLDLDAGKNEAETRKKSEVTDNMAKFTSSETKKTEVPPVPALPPIDATALDEDSPAEMAKGYPQQPPYQPFGFGFGVSHFVPQAQLHPMQGEKDVSQPPDTGNSEVENKAKSEVTDKVDDTAKSTSGETNESESLSLPTLPPIRTILDRNYDKPAQLDTDALVEKAKMLVEQEMLAEEMAAKKKRGEVCTLPALPPSVSKTQVPLLPAAVGQSPSSCAILELLRSRTKLGAKSVYQSSSSSRRRKKLKVDPAKLAAFTAKNPQVEDLPLHALPSPSASAVDQSSSSSSSSSSKKLKVDSARLAAFKAKNAQVEDLPLRALPSPSASAVDQSSSSSNNKEDVNSAKLSAYSERAAKKNVRVEVLPLAAVPLLPPVEDTTEVPLLPSPSASAVDQSSSSSSKKRKLESSQLLKML
eukprot:scaffold2425_cov76-Skeletonema_dohrnii-CCMP3373.AAC.19